MKESGKKTHELGGKLFIIAGIISFAGVLAGDYALWFILIPTLTVSAITVVYSYLEFQKEIQEKTKENLN